MAGFFSLQPQPEGESNLSTFASATPNLEHVGSSQSYLDPSGGHGETLHSPFEDPNLPATAGVRGGSGGLMQTTGDTGATPSTTGGTSAVTGTTTRPSAPSGPQQTQPSTNMSPEQIQAVQALGTTQSILSKVPTSLVKEGTSAIKSATTGTSTNTSEQFLDTNSQEYKDWLQGSGYSDAEAQAALGELGINVGPGAAPTSPIDKFGMGDVQGVLGVAQAGITGDPTQIALSLNRVAPNVVKYITEDKDIVGRVGGVAQALGGAYSLYQGIQNNDPGSIIQGMGALLSGGANTVGMNVISQLTSVPVETLNSALGALGGVTAAYGLYTAIDNGDPVQAILAAGSIYSALSTVAPSIFTPLSTLAAQALISVAPSVAASLGVTVGTTGATLAGAGVSAIAGAVALPVAALVIIATDIASWSEERNNRSSGWWNNPIAGNLSSAMTSGIKQSNDLLDRVDAMGVDNIPPDQLMQILPSLANNLQAYFATAQGGLGPITAKSSIQGLYGRRGTGGQNPAGALQELQDSYNKANSRMERIVDSLLARGVTFEQLGALDLNFNPALQTYEMEDPFQRYYAPRAGEWNAYANERAGGLSSYLQSQPFGQSGQYNGYELTPQGLIERSAFEGSTNTPGRIDPNTGQWIGQAAHNPYTAAFGGPLWTYLARTGYDPNGIIQQNFDPWRAIRGSATDYNTPDEHTRPALMALAQAYQDFTSGGGGF